MYTDNRSAFSDAQVIAGTDETVACTDIIDLGATPSLKSLGFDQCYMQIATAVADTAGGDIEFKIVSASTTDIKTSPVVHWSSGAIAGASARLDAGALVDCVPLAVGANYLRYFGLIYTVTGTTDTYAVNANITPYPVVHTAYPDAI